MKMEARMRAEVVEELELQSGQSAQISTDLEEQTKIIPCKKSDSFGLLHGSILV